MLPCRRWLVGGSLVTFVVQRWYAKCEDVIMNANVTVNLCTCSKQSFDGRRGRVVLKDGLIEAEGRHAHGLLTELHRCRPMDDNE